MAGLPEAVERALVCIELGPKEKSVGDPGGFWGGTLHSICTPSITVDKINNSAAPT